jgi:hypothetical protein
MEMQILKSENVKKSSLTQRLTQTLITKPICVIFRGSRDGMLWKILNTELETRYGDV